MLQPGLRLSLVCKREKNRELPCGLPRIFDVLILTEILGLIRGAGYERYHQVLSQTPKVLADRGFKGCRGCARLRDAHLYVSVPCFYQRQESGEGA